MIMRLLKKIVLAVFLSFSFVLMAKSSQIENEGSAWIKIETPKEAFVGECVSYDVVLYSKSPNISNVKIIEYPGFGEFKASLGQLRYTIQRVTIKSEEYYKCTIARFFLDATDSGNVSIKGGRYQISIGEEILQEDFFWGPFKSMRYKAMILTSPDTKIKVKNLPSLNSKKFFSGAVGDFNVVAWLPPGNILLDKEAIAIIKISGFGLLKDISTPDIKNMFGSTARLKNVKRSDNLVQKDGRLFSEIILECSFIPISSVGELSPFHFTYFNPDKRKYITISSEPLLWNNEDEYSPEDMSKVKTIGI